ATPFPTLNQLDGSFPTDRSVLGSSPMHQVGAKMATPKSFIAALAVVSMVGLSRPRYSRADEPEINGATFIACQQPDPNPDMGGALQPAFAFELPTDRVVNLEAHLFAGFGCEGLPDSFYGSPFRPAGTNTAFVRFDPRLPDGITFSAIWVVDQCATTCVDYVA